MAFARVLVYHWRESFISALMEIESWFGCRNIFLYTVTSALRGVKKAEGRKMQTEGDFECGFVSRMQAVV